MTLSRDWNGRGRGAVVSTEQPTANGVRSRSREARMVHLSLGAFRASWNRIAQGDDTSPRAPRMVQMPYRERNACAEARLPYLGKSEPAPVSVSGGTMALRLSSAEVAAIERANSTLLSPFAYENGEVWR